VRYGTDKGSQRYKCKSCNRTFTEYTGTWLGGIHKKHLADDYIEMMESKSSLDKIKSQLGINKKTAFDWRHKILASVEHSEKRAFEGITESDETYFHLSEKGIKQIVRKPRKRGEAASKRGISDE
jgi:tRNA G26 N,N-dimethylase Trm1